MVTALHKVESDRHATDVDRAIERCRAEIATIEGLLLAGHPDIEGLCMALSDWSAELRLIEREGCADGPKRISKTVFESHHLAQD
jgi:hypothetical protein